VGLDDPLRSLPTLIFYGLEQGHVKKALLNVEWNICQDCKTDNQRQDKSEEEADESPSIWLCLKCGHRGCGRNSQEQHALKHYTTPRSEPHCLATVKSHNWKKIKTGQEKEKKEGVIKEDNSSNTSEAVTVKGLSNLGNTCFFNAVMQEPLVIKLEQPGPLTLAMCQFLSEMQETKKGTVTPKELFAQVCKK
uniref:Ubiquitinyl hydrolase 1 n=1 Tax=Terrapene triunguis TaxID=2587831 RepID=A0A674K2K8_9SAUR